MKNLAIILVLLFSGLRIYAQTSGENFKSALMEKKGGAVVVYSSDKHSFTLNLISNNIKPQNKSGLVIIDNHVLQFILIPNETINADSVSEAYQKIALLGYMNYELDYAKNDLKIAYTNLVTDWVVINNKLLLSWRYDMPAEMIKKDENSTRKQINLSTICFGNVLNLNTPFEKNDTLDYDKALLAKVAKTYTPNNFAIDFDEFYKKLHEQ
jgi:hypothetical protein